MNKTILITGGSGLIGKPLTRLFLEKGFTIHHLSRHPKPESFPGVRVFSWDVFKGTIDEDCLNGVDTIIHLAGEDIAEKAWSNDRKHSIVESRTRSIRLLYDILRKTPGHMVRSVISSSAIGYYGDRKEELLLEDSGPGHGFLADTCIEWEKAVDEGKELQLRVVKLRTGIVLAREGGALPEIARPVKVGLGAVLGSGRQWMSWIHVGDAVRMYAFAAENNSVEGVFNMVAPQPVTNRNFTEILAGVLKKKLWLPSVPPLALNFILGERSRLLLDSDKVSSEKIQAAGFTFEFINPEEALRDLYL